MNYKDPLKMINPAAVAAIANTDMTLQPPIPANQQGVAKPLFSETVQSTAGQIYGDINARQASLGNNAPMFMSASQEKAFGPDSETYKSGNTKIYEGIKAEENKKQ
jgi:hypothetical protein|eukprot:COSAG06_NODE_928_length_11474_cov_3.616264_15_plen_106_part_00